jgi:hypothetical protein
MYMVNGRRNKLATKNAPTAATPAFRTNSVRPQFEIYNNLCNRRTPPIKVWQCLTKPFGKLLFRKIGFTKPLLS